MTNSILSIILLPFSFFLPAGMQENTPSNVHESKRMLVVLSAPSIHEQYYAEDFAEIVAFQKQYARTIMGNDNVVILVDDDTHQYYADDLPEDILLQADVADIWMRDFTTVLPEQMVQFTYASSYLDQQDAEYTQNSFVQFTEAHNLNYQWHDYILDGGNVVDNGKDKLIVSERFLEENNLSKADAKAILRELTGAKEVAIIPYDDDVMGHADGLVMWGGESLLFVNQYDEPFRSSVLRELQSAFPGTNIVEVPVQFELTEWRDFSSACGINLNSVVTYNHIYMPTFGNTEADAAARAAIEQHTAKQVHTVPASGVCHMGGSVRCLSWQIAGENARKLIEAAKAD